MRRPHLRIAGGFACAIVGALVADSCSLFVDLGDLSRGSGDAASDAKTDASSGVDASKDAASDAATLPDTGADASCTGIAMSVQNQHVVADDGGKDTSVYVTLPNATVLGDFIVVGVNFDYGCTNVSTVTDSAGNVYREIVGYDSNGGALALETWGAENVVASSADTVTVTFANSCAGRNIKVVEYSGIVNKDAVDGFVTQHGDGGDLPNAQIATTGPAIVFAHTGDDTHELGAADGWTQLFIDEWATVAEEKSFSAATSVTVTAKPNSDDAWVIQGVALKACKAN